MSLPTSFLDELRNRIDLAAVVGRRVGLKKAGREQAGCCPFHNEKTPSFTVNADKGFYHCFGCGAHGDAIAFVMNTEHLEFREAVERLADEVGLSLPEETPEAKAVEARRATVREVLEAAANAFSAALAAPEGAAAREYLAGRGVSAESIARFRLGWAPAGDAAARLLQSLRAPADLLIEAGLLVRREDGSVGPFFRGRVMFPITDRRGRVIGFGGRALGDTQPKYLNSPASELFDKSATLFGWHLARDSAGKAGRVLAVEGYLDVVMLHQAGVAEAVAPLGTALTEQHGAALFRLAPRLVLCLDGDKAGRAAAIRGLDVLAPLLTSGRRLDFATLPEGEDPDSLVRSGGRAALDEVLAVAAPLSAVLWQVADERCRPDESPEQRAAFERELMARLSLVPDGPTRLALLGEYRRRLRWGWDGDGPQLQFRKSLRPLPAELRPWMEAEWARALEAPTAETVRAWLAKEGCSLAAITGALGGVGWIRGKMFNARPGPTEPWGAPKTPLWDERGQDSLVVLPCWEGVPKESALLDLVAWNAKSGAIARRSGAAVVLGRSLLDEALGFEARGLPRALRVTGSPLRWLRDLGGGPERRSLLVVDWARAWEALGLLSASVLVADDEATAHRLEAAILPPRAKVADVVFETGEG